MGLLVAQGGAWNGKQILPKGWTAELVKPCPVAPFYGLMWWLNTDRRQFAAASERATSRSAGAATSSGSIPTTISSRCCAGSTASKAGGFVERLLGAINK